MGEPAANESRTDGTASLRFSPYIPPEAMLREMTPRAVILGALLGMVFGASSLYLVLKVGITVSASIPVAVISVTLFRLLSRFGARNATILENNIVQTAGSAGESIAFGVGVTMPAIMILGFDLELTRVLLVAVLGGLLGILMMIPLRRALIVQQHGKLKYPEGTACAEVLKAAASEESRAAAVGSAGFSPFPGGGQPEERPEGRTPNEERPEGRTPNEERPEGRTPNEEGRTPNEEGRTPNAGGLKARTIFAGFGIGLAYKTAMSALKLWKEAPEKVFAAPFKAASVGAEISPELLGVGYIIGPRIAATLAAGGALAYLVLIPLIKFFGENLAAPLEPGTILIRDMSVGDVRSAYVLYIGAGAVAAGGLISLLRSLPLIGSGLREGLRDAAATSGVPRPSSDLGVPAHDTPKQELGRGTRAKPAGAGVPRPSSDLGVPAHGTLKQELERGTPANTPKQELERGTRALPAGPDPHRTEHDLPAKLVYGGIAALVLAIWLAPPLHMNLLGAVLVVAFGFLFVTVSSRLTGEIGSTSNPISGMTVATLLFTCLFFLAMGWTGGRYYVTALSVGAIVCIAASNGGTTSQDLKTGFLVGATPRLQQISILIGALLSAVILGPVLLRLNAAATVYVPIAQVAPAGLATDPSQLGEARERLSGPQAKEDARSYRVWHKTDDVGGPAGRYLVDDAGRAVWLVDPGINGRVRTRPDGSEVRKFDAPKAVLVSYLIRGILDRKLPWALVLFGVMIAVILEMASVPSLVFAVGVYLPISSSAPIFFGGALRWLVDRHMRRRLARQQLSEARLQEEADRSPGVLMASGYIAGGAIAGIIIAFMAGVLEGLDRTLTHWAQTHNPFFAGPSSDLLALIPFAGLIALLYIAGRGISRDGIGGSKIEN